MHMGTPRYCASLIMVYYMKYFGVGTPHAWMASWMVGGCSLVECQWRVERVKLSIVFS